MSDSHWSPWKMTAIGMALVIVTALLTGLVVANWAGKEPPGPVASGGSVRHVAVTPTATDVDSCNRYAASVGGERSIEVLKDALIGGAVGAGVGAAGGAIAGVVGATAGPLYGINQANKNDVRSAEAYCACTRGRGYNG